MNDRRYDLAQVVFATLLICGLLAAALWVVAPFAAAIIWATTIVVATWPLLLKLQKMLGGRRGMATTVLTIALLLLVVVPFLAGFGALLKNREAIVMKVDQLRPHGSLRRLLGREYSLVGTHAASAWQDLAGGAVRDLAAQAAPYVRQALNWLISSLGSVAGLFFQLLMTVIVCAVLYNLGDAAAGRLRKFAQRVGGDRGENAVVLAGQAIRGVALGVVVTAVGQSFLAGLGLFIARPFASVLTAVAFVLCIAQVRSGARPHSRDHLALFAADRRGGARSFSSGRFRSSRSTTSSAPFSSRRERTCRCFSSSRASSAVSFRSG